MKKLITSILLAVMLAPSVLASDFSYGQDANGLYYYNEAKTLVYSRDASCLMQATTANANCTTQWYVKKHKMQRPDAYYNRIRAMLILQAQ